MKSLNSFLLVAGLSLGVGAQAHLILIPEGEDWGAPSSSRPSAEATWIEGTQMLTSGSLIYLNKYEYDEAAWDNAGALGQSYFTTPYPNPNGEGWCVSWDLLGSDLQMAYVLVKAGQQVNLYEVSLDQAINNGVCDVVQTPFGDEYSHISYFGVRSTQVPDAGTSLLLLSAGLLGLGAVRRKLN